MNYNNQKKNLGIIRFPSGKHPSVYNPEKTDFLRKGLVCMAAGSLIAIPIAIFMSSATALAVALAVGAVAWQSLEIS